MAKTGNYPVYFLVLILSISGLLAINPVAAQNMPVPSTPKFTLQYADNSYTVSSNNTTTDPYTGKAVSGSASYRVDNRSITVNITNQPFTPFTDNGTEYYLFYHVFKKGHYAGNWTSFAVFTQTQNKDYTELSEQAALQGEIDYKVQAFIGHYKYSSAHGSPTMLNPAVYSPYDWEIVADAESDCSILTIKIPEGTVSDSSPNPSPTIPEFPFILLLTSLMAIPLIVIFHKTNQSKGKS